MSFKALVVLIAVCLVVTIVGLVLGIFARLPGDWNGALLLIALGASLAGQVPCRMLRNGNYSF